jgi:hypothetical protein
MEMLKQMQRDQPSLRAEMRAFVRQGREDLLATLMGPLAGQTREPGAPGTPTPQQVTQGLEGKDVNLQKDRIVPPKAPEKQPELEMGR